MNNTTSIRVLDARYVAEFDEYQWMHIDMTNGPRLNFRQTSVLGLRNFLNDPTLQTSTISERYRVERSGEEAMILHTGIYRYPFSPVATQQLRDFLNEVAEKEKDDTPPIQ
jgi:hypothetical protein